MSDSAPDAADTALERHLGYWLRLVSNEVSGEFARKLQQHDLSVAEWVALNELTTSTIPTPGTLAALTSMTRGAISKILEKLAAKKLVSRLTSKTDHRVQLLEVTAAGRRLLPRLTLLADDNDRHYFSALAESEQTMLRSLLRKLAAAHRMTRVPVE